MSSEMSTLGTLFGLRPPPTAVSIVFTTSYRIIPVRSRGVEVEASRKLCTSVFPNHRAAPSLVNRHGFKRYLSVSVDLQGSKMTYLPVKRLHSGQNHCSPSLNRGEEPDMSTRRLIIKHWRCARLPTLNDLACCSSLPFILMIVTTNLEL